MEISIIAIWLSIPFFLGLFARGLEEEIFNLRRIDARDRHYDWNIQSILTGALWGPITVVFRLIPKIQDYRKQIADIRVTKQRISDENERIASIKNQWKANNYLVFKSVSYNSSVGSQSIILNHRIEANEVIILFQLIKCDHDLTFVCQSQIEGEFIHFSLELGKYELHSGHIQVGKYYTMTYTLRGIEKIEEFSDNKIIREYRHSLVPKSELTVPKWDHHYGNYEEYFHIMIPK